MNRSELLSNIRDKIAIINKRANLITKEIKILEDTLKDMPICFYLEMEEIYRIGYGRIDGIWGITFQEMPCSMHEKNFLLNVPLYYQIMTYPYLDKLFEAINNNLSSLEDYLRKKGKNYE